MSVQKVLLAEKAVSGPATQLCPLGASQAPIIRIAASMPVLGRLKSLLVPLGSEALTAIGVVPSAPCTLKTSAALAPTPVPVLIVIEVIVPLPVTGAQRQTARTPEVPEPSATSS
jgi:hypothetical protein